MVSLSLSKSAILKRNLFFLSIFQKKIATVWLETKVKLIDGKSVRWAQGFALVQMIRIVMDKLTQRDSGGE